MALYAPVVIWEKAIETCRIPRTEDSDGITNYIIEVGVSHYKWCVSRRYKQFVELHEKLVKEYNIDKNLLPPKKIFGNRSESFINERRKGLEFYLQALIRLFSILPESFALFLDFHKYEVRFITANLAENFFCKGEEILASSVPHEFTPVQLHAISERLKLGEPTCSKNPRQDIAHLVDFITQLKHLVIVGSNEYYGASNITPNELSFDLSLFKNVVTIEMFNLNISKSLGSVDSLRSRLKTLIIHKTLSDISEILLCGIIHWCSITDPIHTWPYWNYITHVNFSYNKLTKIHSSIKLLSSVKHIDLSHNEIQVIEHMETLSELSILILSHNKIHDVDSLHTRLGNIHSLNLSSNKIRNLQGFSKLFSISELNLESNLISSLGEINHLCKLPCLEVLNFQHNPVTLTVDYRPQVLLLFGSLAQELVLDGLKATEKEIDTVSILQALKQARNENSSTDQKMSKGESSSNSNNYTSHTKKQLDQSSPGENATKKVLNNFYESSKFRQQVETLRKIGGSDWLRLLNELHSSKGKTDLILDKNVDTQRLISDNYLNCGIYMENVNFNDLTTQLFESLTSSFEISYPDWLLNLDVASFMLEQLLPSTHFHERLKNSFHESAPDYLVLIKSSKLLWVVLLDRRNNLMYEVPVCVLMSHYEIMFFQLKTLVNSDKHSEFKLLPEFVFLKSVLPYDIISLTIGPCDAYAELKIKCNNTYENIVILMMDVETAAVFVSEFHNLYNVMPTYKLNPFAKKMLELETIKTGFSFAEISVQKQIIFGQRVCVSKSLHKCQHGILHYAFITPSHLLLIEEKLNSLCVTDLDAVTQPQFQICSLINVHTNINQIHLKDASNASEICHSLHQEKLKSDSYHVDKLDILYKSGSWLIIEFESKLLLYLNFFSLKQRNEFLDKFLSVRNQR